MFFFNFNMIVKQGFRLYRIQLQLAKMLQVSYKREIAISEPMFLQIISSQSLVSSKDYIDLCSNLLIFVFPYRAQDGE